MSKSGSANGSFFGNFVYDQLLRRRPHFLHDLTRALDFAFVKEALRDFYVDWGRDPWDLVLMFKMVFLQFLYDLSDRDIEEQCTWNMLFKCFLGLSTEELPPDHSTLCRFRLRLGAEGFQRLFNQTVDRARELTGDKAYDSKANRSYLLVLDRLPGAGRGCAPLKKLYDYWQIPVSEGGRLNG
jgi:hypothetical protein